MGSEMCIRDSYPSGIDVRVVWYVLFSGRPELKTELWKLEFEEFSDEIVDSAIKAKDNALREEGLSGKVRYGRLSPEEFECRDKEDNVYTFKNIKRKYKLLSKHKKASPSPTGHREVMHMGLPIPRGWLEKLGITGEEHKSWRRGKKKKPPFTSTEKLENPETVVRVRETIGTDEILGEKPVYYPDARTSFKDVYYMLPGAEKFIFASDLYANELMFGISAAGLEKDLNKGIIPEELMNKFETERLKLLEPSIRKGKEGIWQIIDGDTIYVIEKEGEELKIYRNMGLEFIKRSIRDDLGGEVTSIDAMGLKNGGIGSICLLYTSPSPRDLSTSRMPSSA